MAAQIGEAASCVFAIGHSVAALSSGLRLSGVLGSTHGRRGRFVRGLRRRRLCGQTFLSSCDELTSQPICWTVTAPLASTHLKYVFATASLPASTSNSGGNDRRIDAIFDHSCFIVDSAPALG